MQRIVLLRDQRLAGLVRPAEYQTRLAG